MANNFFKKHFFPSNWLNTWRPYFYFFLVVFIIYGQTLFFGLTYLDDNNIILDKLDIISHLKNLNIIFSTDAFFSDNRLYYRPMLNLSFMVDAQFGALNYTVYHLANLFWHLLSGSLVFLMLKRLFRSVNLNSSSLLAFFLTLIFLVHPALSQAVAWLPGRNDPLVAVFILLAFWFFLNFVDRPKLSSWLAYLGFFWLALLSKETVVFFPLLIIIYFLTLGKEKNVSRRDQGLVIIGSAAVGFLWYLMRSFALGSQVISLGAAVDSVFVNLPAALVMGAKLFLPFNLAVLPVAVDTSMIFSVIAWPAIILAFIFSRHKNWHYLIFGSAWFLIFFLPPFVVSAGAPFLFEHRLYLPLIGILIALFGFDGIRRLDWNNKKVWLTAAVILCLFSAINVLHSRTFREPLIFWQTAVKESPHSPLAQKNLGVMYYLDGQSAKAVPYYLAALKLNPNEPMVHNNLGVIYLEHNNLASATPEFLQELALNPRYDKSLFNLGEVYFRQNNLVEARYYWQEALRINPNYNEPYLGLLKLDKQIKPGQAVENNVK